MNDADRADWVNNDESLYNWWRASRQGMTTFVRENRRILTEYIDRVLNREPLS